MKELSELKNEFYEVMYKYEKSFSEKGVMADLTAWQTAKADLISLLLNDATYESSGSLSAKQSLLIELDNGLVYQFTVKNDKIASCGTWSCPEFFEAFEAACE